MSGNSFNLYLRQAFKAAPPIFGILGRTILIKNPRLVTTLFFTLVLAVSCYFYLFHLAGAMVLNTDENRAYHFTLQSPLVFLIPRPFVLLFKSTDAVHYVWGVIGIMNVLLLSRITYILFGRNTCLWVTLFYVLYDFPLSYAKLIYYSTPAIFIMLISLLTIFSALKNKSFFKVIILGLFCGVLFFLNPSTYAISLSLLVFTLFLSRQETFCLKGKIPIWKIMVGLACGVLLAVLSLESLIYILFSNVEYVSYQPYLKFLFWYQDRVSTMGISTASIAHFFPLFIEGVISISKESIYRNSFIVIVILISFFISVKNKNKKMFGIILFMFAGAGILFINSALEIHHILPRMLVWTSIPIAISFGYAMNSLFKYKGAAKHAIMLMVIMYFIFSAIKCHAITHSMFSVNEIDRYFSEKGISKSQVATILHINRHKDFISRNFSKSFPLIPNPNEESVGKSIHYRIFWPQIYTAYQKGTIKYYLSSGLSHWSNIGDDDPLLIHTEPIKVWDYHPMNNRHLHWTEFHKTIKLYRLEDIFKTAKAFEFLRKKQRQDQQNGILSSQK